MTGRCRQDGRRIATQRWFFTPPQEVGAQRYESPPSTVLFQRSGFHDRLGAPLSPLGKVSSRPNKFCLLGWRSEGAHILGRLSFLHRGNSTSMRAH